MSFVNNNTNNNNNKYNIDLFSHTLAPSEVKRGGNGATPSEPTAAVSTVATDGWVPSAEFPTLGERKG